VGGLGTSQGIAGDLRSRAARRVGFALLALGLVCVFGVIGYAANGWSVADAIYMVAITISTVGFGEVRPIQTTALRTHTILLLGFGTVTLTYFVASVLQFVAEGEILRVLGYQRVKRQIEALKGHIVVVGLGRMGALVCTELAEAGVPFVVIDRSTERAAQMDANGWPYLIGEATEETVLRAAGLERARALVAAIPNDAVNVFITLTAREMAPNVRILARAEQPTTQKKLLQAGADHVVLPASIGAHRAVTTLLNPGAVRLSELLTKSTGVPFELLEVAIERGSRFVGRTLRDADVGRLTGAMVIAIKKATGRIDFPPRGHEALGEGDHLILLGRREDLDRFREVFPTA
jgi:voltage-gated potassium channel